MSVPDAVGTGRSGREASPGGPATAAAMAPSAPSEVGPERAAQRERARSRATADPLRRWEGSRAARESGRSVRDGRGAAFWEGRVDVMVSGGSCVLYILNNAPETQIVTNKVQEIVKPPMRRLNNQSRQKRHLTDEGSIQRPYKK